MQYNHELDRYAITHVDTLKRCMLGGRGTVCLVSPSGKAHTYKFNKPLNKDQYPDDVIFVNVLHESKYFYIGMIEGHRFRVTKHSRFDEDSESVKGAKYLMEMINVDGFFKSTRMKVYHTGRCSVCGRKLTSENAIQIGVGNKCLRKLKARLDVRK